MSAGAAPGELAYPRLFSEWRIRNTAVPNRIVFAPTCPTWVADPHEGVFTEQAVAYYEERAKSGCGLIIIGGTVIHREALYSEFLFPGLWKDEQIEGLARVAEAVHRHGCKLAVQLLHVGLRAMAVLKKQPDYDFDAEWYMVGPSQVPPGEYPNAPMPKELEEHEIEDILEAYASAARRAVAAGLDGVEFHMSHGYLPWQFLSPLYNHRTDRWGGSYENRMRFPVEALHRIRAAIGDEPFVGYRINSTSFWPGDLELDDVKQIVGDFERRADVDYVNLSAGVHHSYIHTPMTYEDGWERGYTKAVKEVSTKPVLLVGRITHPNVAEYDPRGRRGRRDPARPPALRRRRVGAQGEGGAQRRHPPLRRRQLLLADRHPRRSRPVHLQPGGRARGEAGEPAR